MDAVHGAGTVVGREHLQLLFGFFDGVAVEQLAQIGVAKELAQLFLIDGERLGTTLGQRCVAVVDVVGDVREEQRRREG